MNTDSDSKHRIVLAADMLYEQSDRRVPDGGRGAPTGRAA